MRIGVIGAGSMGGILARQLVMLGHQVSIANSRGPESLTALAVEIGTTPASLVDAAKAGEVVVIAIPTKAVADLPRTLFSNVPNSVVVIDIGNYHPELRDGHIDAIDRGMLDSQWVAQQIGRPVIKAFNNILAKSLLEKGVPRGTTGRIALSVAGDSLDARPQCFVLSMILASIPSTVVIWTTPGASSPERRLTARTLKRSITPLHSGSPTYDGEIVIPSHFTSLIHASAMYCGPQSQRIASPRATSFRKSPKAWRTPWRMGPRPPSDPRA